MKDIIVEWITNKIDFLSKYLSGNKESISLGIYNIILFIILGFMLLFFLVRIIDFLYYHRFAVGSFDEIINKKIKKGIMYESKVAKILNVERVIKTCYPEYSQYIIVQYGSSAREDVESPNDYDLIVLLIGTTTNEVKEILQIGNKPKVSIKKTTEVDIVFRDYLSFLFAACSGMPYENSVIYDGKLIHGHLGYFKWLKRISKNILMDKKFLIKRLEERLTIEREAYEKASNLKDIYELIRAAYYYTSSILQKKWIDGVEDILYQDKVKNMAYVKNLVDFIEDDKDKKMFLSLVNYLKRKELPTDISNFDKRIEKMINNIIGI